MAFISRHPPVAANLAAFLLLAVAEVGALRAVIWLLTATSLCWLMEISSTHTGFPFGFYTYHRASYPDDVWLGTVPLFASLGFGSLMYFGYSAALTLLSPLRLEGWTVRRHHVPGLATSWRALLLAAISITWMDLVMDPVTHLGRYWFLGDLYHYEPGGLHFGVPLSNYAGWLLTSLVVVGTNQQIDRWLEAIGRRAEPAFDLPFRPLWAIGCQAGTYVMMLAVTVSLIGAPSVPPEVPLGGILVNGLVLTGLHAVFVGVMLRRAFARPAGCA